MMKFQFNPLRRILQIGLYFLINAGIAQNAVDYHSWFDQKVGQENTALFNGYFDNGEGEIERNRSLDGSQRYFLNFDFFVGSIIYEQQNYNTLYIKYDVFKDELLLILKSSQGSVPKIRLIRDRVQGFNIKGHTFVNLMNFKSADASYAGFAEMIYSGATFHLLLKHEKKRSEEIVDSRVVYKYRTVKSYILHYQGNFYPVKRQKQFVKLFPGYKNEMRTYKIRKATVNKDMLIYAKRLDLLVSNNNR